MGVPQLVSGFLSEEIDPLWEDGKSGASYPAILLLIVFLCCSNKQSENEVKKYWVQ